jgi:hypothetical protein
MAEEGKLHRSGGRPTSNVSCKQARWQAGAAAQTQQSGVGKLVKVAVGGKLHRIGGRPTSHVSCKQTHRPEKVGAVYLPQCAQKGESL